MDQDRTVHTLDDQALGREIEEALAVDPSPEFLARVRTRIGSETMSLARGRAWWLVGAGALAIAVVAAVIVGRLEREPASEQVIAMPAVESPPTAAPAKRSMSPPARTVVTPEQAAGRRRGPVQLAARITESEVLVAPGEATALRLLVATIREGRIDPSVLDRRAVAAPLESAPLEPLDEIAIQPLAIEPLPRLALLEGAPQ